MGRRFLSAVVGFVAAVPAHARADGAHIEMQFDGPRGRLHLDLPVFDAPANTAGPYIAESMEQSKWVTADAYEAAHYGLDALFGRKKWYGLLVESAFDATTILVSVPFFGGWQHEEWHRAVLSRRGISSDNPYYSSPTLPLFDPKTIQVSDADVARLKAEHPVDYVRAGEAGFEGQYALASELERNAFFRDQPNVSSFIIGMSYIETSLYMGICNANPTGTGDCTLWSDGLFAPKAKPHADGTPLSAGIESYLKTQLGLSFLNFLDPFVFLMKDLRIADVRVAAALRHVPTSFGYDLKLDVFYRDARRGLLFSAHNFVNGAMWFPGASVELLRMPLGPLEIGGRAMLWLQPEDRAFFTESPRPGADVALNVGVPLFRDRLVPYVELEAKTAGWVMGNAFDEATPALRVGLQANAF
jgi:hypothetical protein